MKGQLKFYLMLFLACMIWGLTPICGRVLKDCMSPMLITGARFYLVALILFTSIYLIEGKKGLYLSRHDFLVLLLMGFVGIFLHNSLLFEALRMTPASNAALIESIGPSITSTLAFIIIGERLSKFGWLGIFISCFGAGYIVCKGSLDTLLHFQVNLGEIIVVVCEAMWSFYVVISWKLSKNVNALAVTAWTGLFGAIFCTLAGLIFNELHVYAITKTYIEAFLVLSLLTGVVAFVLWNFAITKVGASKGGTFVYLIPVFGAVFGVVLLGEEFTLQEFIGALIVVIGMIISVKAKLSVRSNTKSVSEIKKHLIEKQALKLTSEK
jgi:drug/metabolite transporter (DMT)-like permease